MNFILELFEAHFCAQPSVANRISAGLIRKLCTAPDGADTQDIYFTLRAGPRRGRQSRIPCALCQAILLQTPEEEIEPIFAKERFLSERHNWDAAEARGCMISRVLLDDGVVLVRVRCDVGIYSLSIHAGQVHVLDQEVRPIIGLAVPHPTRNFYGPSYALAIR